MKAYSYLIHFDFFHLSTLDMLQFPHSPFVLMLFDPSVICSVNFTVLNFFFFLNCDELLGAVAPS